MPKALIDNVAGHKSKYEILAAHLPADQVGAAFVGATDPILTGFHELELIRRYKDVQGSFVVDIGCGIGRLTRHMLHENVAGYLGIDVVPQILQEAIDVANGNEKFRFDIAKECRIPQGEASADIVVAFSVITHLIDEEVFEYFAEARRVLRSGGMAIFSFLDFLNPVHRESFFRHARQHRHGHGDMLKFTTADVLRLFAEHLEFSSVEFIDGSQPMPISGVPSNLLDVKSTAQTFCTGQSACILRV
ncbi:class I SAM-dependent methyltransferase [Burkholderia vietnamiensis]